MKCTDMSPDRCFHVSFSFCRIEGVHMLMFWSGVVVKRVDVYNSCIVLVFVCTDDYVAVDLINHQGAAEVGVNSMPSAGFREDVFIRWLNGEDLPPRRVSERGVYVYFACI